MIKETSFDKEWVILHIEMAVNMRQNDFFKQEFCFHNHKLLNFALKKDETT